jgi:hypothetical protein
MLVICEYSVADLIYKFQIFANNLQALSLICRDFRTLTSFDKFVIHTRREGNPIKILFVKMLLIPDL